MHEVTRMSRGSFTKGFITELDGLRGIAILMVMVHRFWPRTGVGLGADVAGAGWIGVDLFFVISGFLIAGILLDTKNDEGYFRKFYARRMLRIFPLYYLFVIAVLVGFSHNSEFQERAGSPLWYLFHLGNVPEGVLGNDVPYWLAPVWSLAIEEQFYLTFPWLVYFLDRRKLTIVLVGMIALAPVIRLVTMLSFPEQERMQYLFTLCRIDTIAIGCLLAVIVRAVDIERWRMKAMAAGLVLLPCVAVLSVMSRLDRTSPFDRVFGYSIVAVGCATVVALAILSRGKQHTAPLRWKPLTYLGKLCFGLYILHRPADTIVSALAARIGFEGDLWLLAPKIVVAVALATVSWRLLEKPFLALKDRYRSALHPSVTTMIVIGGLVAGLAACGQPGGTDRPDGGDPTRDGEIIVDDGGVIGDGSVGEGLVLYPEGTRHSPITPQVAARLETIAAHNARVFAKVGDSITVTTNFMTCFDGGNVDLGAHGGLSTTLAYFMAGDAAGSSPFARTSLAAKGGTTALDALTGTPCPFDQEVNAINPQLSIVMFGTNEIRYGWTFQEFGDHLWDLVDKSIGRGSVPVMSTIPPNPGYAEADARVPTANRIVRAIAQGRGVPLVDLHRDLEALPNRGISGDGLHPSVAPSGACVLTTSGLAYGYNMRNLIVLEALARARAALANAPPDASAPTRAGEGTEADPFGASLPLVDLGDTRTGEAYVNHGCGAATGKQIAYRMTLATPTLVDAFLVDRTADVDVRIVVNGTCVAAGDSGASAVVSGNVVVLVAARSASSGGEYLLVVEPRR